MGRTRLLATGLPAGLRTPVGSLGMRHARRAWTAGGNADRAGRPLLRRKAARGGPAHGRTYCGASGGPVPGGRSRLQVPRAGYPAVNAPAAHGTAATDGARSLARQDTPASVVAGGLAQWWPGRRTGDPPGRPGPRPGRRAGGHGRDRAPRMASRVSLVDG